nr:MAG TPA: hypothetical protein [Caudoviricetes sp.]
MWITPPSVAILRQPHPQTDVDKAVCTCESLVGTSTFPQVIHNQSTQLPTQLPTRTTKTS